MIEKAKITLSDKELDLVCNTDWILTKHSIIKKVYEVFGELSILMQQSVKSMPLPDNIIAIGPKISKGENYQQLPFVMLDYPRCFDKENTFAIRTFFWWGNFFSCTLHLSGKYQQQYSIALEKNFQLLQQNNYSICIADNPWQHYFEDDNYTLLKNCSKELFNELLSKRKFLKIAKQHPIEQWNNATTFLSDTFNEIISFLKD